MKIQSIHRQLVKNLSISITLVTVIILLMTDIAIDKWVHDEFNRAMRTKAHLLTTLVKEDVHNIEFDFAGEFMPEFEGEVDPEYYQLWLGKEVFERSDTLDIFATKSLPYKNATVGEELLIAAELPDGRDGKILYYRFFPQIDSDDRQEYNKLIASTGYQQKPMLLAYAMSAEKLHFLTWMIDISFLVSALLVAFIVRTIVKKTVKKGLTPLDEFTQSLLNISLADKSAAVNLVNKVEELIPIQNSINKFIDENRNLYLKEQRLTSDIAHELKTPIAELISLTEVSIKFPDDITIGQTYKTDILAISSRLQSIVANILLFHRYSHDRFEKNDVFDPVQVITRLINSSPRCLINKLSEIDPINSNLFAFESIFTNILKNAHHYSLEATDIIVYIKQTSRYLSISVSNTSASCLRDDDLNNMFDPLWQKDSARSSTENFGLGLSIVQTFVLALEGDISVSLREEVITFTVLFPIL
ncbi:ATP-binding protein [Alteromonas lipotrueiana]|uniref:ATP-binding protein n=1 Tax=Alteromonas lipotrueiana TaxID=2803815 RepID=UPI001C455DA5